MNNNTTSPVTTPAFTSTCVECHRTFDLLDKDDAAEWSYGHDCETQPAISMTFKVEELRTISAALREAIFSLEDSVYDLTRAASDLREGLSVFPFADGEDGAIAAERMAADKTHRVSQYTVISWRINEMVEL